MSIRIRAAIIRVVKQDDSWPGRKPVRELLPWADPYIAQLVRRLETHYGPAAAGDAFAPPGVDDAPWREDGLDNDSFPDDFDDGWRDDAFMPPPIDAPRRTWPAPTTRFSFFGGFPLLEDLDERPPSAMGNS